MRSTPPPSAASASSGWTWFSSFFSREKGTEKELEYASNVVGFGRLSHDHENGNSEFERRVTIKYLIDFTALVLLYAFVFFGRWRAKGRDILLVNTLMYVYLSFVLYFTLMPVITSIPFVLDHPYKPMNLVPFIDVSLGRGDFLRQVVLNIIMTMPFGFLFPLTQNGAAKFGRTVLFCFLMSLGIELLQPLISGPRSSDVTDIITNVTGGMIGYGFYVIFRPVTRWILAHLKAGD